MQEKELNDIFDKYNLDTNDRNYLIKIVNPITNHVEFQKRMTNEFMHHGSITLGMHILEDMVISYLIAKKKKNVNIDLVVIIALFHDLYTIPWQNNKDAHVKYFINKHGFRHPIEAVVNAITWYPDYFKNIDEAIIIVDRIIHHMFPLKVREFNK